MYSFSFRTIETRFFETNKFVFISMPEATRKIFISAFSRLPQRVIWKWENASDGMPDLPPNVRLCSWLPPMLGNLIKNFIK